MRLWIGVHLPLLPLEACRPRWSEPRAQLVVERGRVLAASRAALDAGVRAGMRQAGALALCPDAAAVERDRQRERRALDGIALCLLQYTPEVALAERDSLLMDVSASLRAFGGIRRLYGRIAQGVLDLGFTAQLALAPTAQGAWLLAQAGASHGRCRVLQMTTLTKALDALSCRLLPSLLPYLDWLDGIGCRTLGGLRRLPRAGLRRRCDAAVLEQLDRAYGQAPELFDWIAPPEVFAARLELPDRIDHAQALLFGARRLLLQMIGWLVIRQRAVERFTLLFEHERGRQAMPPTLLEIALAEAAWQEPPLTRLLQERLARMALPAPVIALRLEVGQTTTLMPPSAALFPDPARMPAEFRRLIELLAARLGEEGVRVPAPQQDHRPEAANRWLPAGAAQSGKPAKWMKSTKEAGLPDNERPFWLLDCPIELALRGHRPFYGSPLRLAGSAERIECGWWDGGLAVRDYFVATDAGSACYWIYRERRGDDIRWYLHGLFG